MGAVVLALREDAKLNVLRRYARIRFDSLSVNPQRQQFKLDPVGGGCQPSSRCTRPKRADYSQQPEYEQCLRSQRVARTPTLAPSPKAAPRIATTTVPIFDRAAADRLRTKSVMSPIALRLFAASFPPTRLIVSSTASARLRCYCSLSRGR